MTENADRAPYKAILGLLERKGRLSVETIRNETEFGDQQIRATSDVIVGQGLARQVPDTDPQEWAR